MDGRPRDPDRARPEADGVAHAEAGEPADQRVGPGVDLRHRHSRHRHPHVPATGRNVAAASSGSTTGVPGLDRRGDLAGPAVDPLDGAVALVEHPDGTLARGDEARVAAERGGRGDAVGPRVDPVELALLLVGYPDVAVVGRHTVAAGQGDLRLLRARAGIEARQVLVVVLFGNHPDRALTDTDAAFGVIHRCSYALHHFVGCRIHLVDEISEDVGDPDRVLADADAPHQATAPRNLDIDDAVVRRIDAHQIDAHQSRVAHHPHRTEAEG